MLRETTLRSKNTEFKQVGLAKYFDEVLVKTIDNRFLDFEKKMVHGIRSRSYKLFPVNEVLAHRLSEHLKNQDVKKQEVQPWEKNTLQLTDSNKESKI